MNKIKDTFAKFQFWWAKRTLKDGRDFSLGLDDLGLYVTILTGPYKDVEYRYANIQVREEDEGVVDFHTVVRYNPSKVDVTNPKFVSLTSNILRILFQDAFMGEEHRLNVDTQVVNENRNTDTVESDQERGFYEESTPLLEKRVSKRKSGKKTVPADSTVHSEVQQPSKPKRTRSRTTGKKRSNRK